MSVAQAVGFFNDQTSSTVNVTLASTGSNSLILLLVNYISTIHGTSFVAGAASVTAADFTFTDSNDNFLISYWSIPSIASGLTTATLHMSTSAFLAGIIIEETNLVTSAAFDQSSSNYQIGATSWTSNSTPTTSQASEIAYGAILVPAVVAGAYYGTLGSGWAALSGTGITAGVSSEATAGMSLLGIRQVLSTTGTYAATGSAATNDSYAALIGTYKVASGGGIPACYFRS